MIARTWTRQPHPTPDLLRRVFTKRMYYFGWWAFRFNQDSLSNLIFVTCREVRSIYRPLNSNTNRSTLSRSQLQSRYTWHRDPENHWGQGMGQWSQSWSSPPIWSGKSLPFSCQEYCWYSDLWVAQKIYEGQESIWNVYWSANHPSPVRGPPGLPFISNNTPTEPIVLALGSLRTKWATTSSEALRSISYDLMSW